MSGHTRKVASEDDLSDAARSYTEDEATRRNAGAGPVHGMIALSSTGTRQVHPEDEDELSLEQRARRLPLGQVLPGAMLCDDCIVEETIYPHESERPGLFRCAAPEGPVVVKVAATQFPPKRELWGQLVSLRNQNVLRTYRTVERDGFFYEIQEYCSGGTLESRIPGPGRPPTDVGWIEAVFIPQILQALNYLHAQGIIHRDIKPSNIYIKPGEPECLVLGDFDISSVLDQARTSRNTQRVAGTWRYSSPEAFPRFIDPGVRSLRARVTRASDYYSLGVTLVELLVGTTSLHACELPDLFDFYLQGGRVKIPVGIHDRLAALLRGLLIRDRHNRWTDEEVERWLAKANTRQDLKRIQDDAGYELAASSRPYRLNTRSAVDLPGLAEAMASEPEVATEDLLQRDQLVLWVSCIDSNVAREIDRDRDRLRQWPEVALFSAIMRCDPTRPFVFPDGSEASTPTDWIGQAEGLAVRQPSMATALVSEAALRKFEIWLRLRSTPDPDVADLVVRIRSTALETRLEELGYLLIPDRRYQITTELGECTPAGVARATYGAPGDWGREPPETYQRSFSKWRNGGLYAWMRQRDLADLAQRCTAIAAGELAPQPRAAFEAILRELDPALPQVKVEIDMTVPGTGVKAVYGQGKRVLIPYRTSGAGIPYGTMVLTNSHSGIHLGSHSIADREGEIALIVDANNDIPVSFRFTASLALQSGFTEIAGQPVSISYAVTYPVANTLVRMAVGGAVGAVALGIPRWALSAMGQPRSLSPLDLGISDLWTSVTQWQFARIEDIVGLLILLGCLYLAGGVGFAALRRVES